MMDKAKLEEWLSNFFLFFENLLLFTTKNIAYFSTKFHHWKFYMFGDHCVMTYIWAKTCKCQYLRFYWLWSLFVTFLLFCPNIHMFIFCSNSFDKNFWKIFLKMFCPQNGGESHWKTSNIFSCEKLIPPPPMMGKTQIKKTFSGDSRYIWA